MPADKSKIGTGRRRQGATEPDRRDDRNRSLERAMEAESTAEDEFERRKQPGAHGSADRSDPLRGDETA